MAQIKARQKQGVDELFQDMDAARRLVFDTQVVELENQIECLIAGDVARAETVQILGSVPRIGPVASTMLIAEISGLGQISTEQKLPMTAVHCVENGPSVAGGICCGMSCSKPHPWRTIIIRS